MTWFDVPHLLDALKDGRHSDVTVKCGNRKWRLHKVVLCSRSDYFKAALSGNFKAGHLRQLCMFDSCQDFKREDNRVRLAAQVYVLADYLLIQDLKHRLCDLLNTCLTNKGLQIKQIMNKAMAEFQVPFNGSLRIQRVMIRRAKLRMQSGKINLRLVSPAYTTGYFGAVACAFEHASQWPELEAALLQLVTASERAVLTADGFWDGMLRHPRFAAQVLSSLADTYQWRQRIVDEFWQEGPPCVAVPPWSTA
ncbi:uncharacterized protein E0L32_004130 [Thyridium curvatum]|uniref:BTB domain-containing protein n=1 Tax=Thyridium curvatum TaxID=1093900 RepID=A0A507AZ77_9PEZI|nr:uncharacterized protein E0L32_004130 [Thyridium curvatum]TPX16135.1 hypothetical protein E0L32_004130 [Thyridium curvatum]